MNTIEAPPQQQSRSIERLAAALASASPEPPALRVLDRITLRICLALITRIEQHATREHEQRLRLNALAREQRELAAERLRRLSAPQR